MPTCRPDKGRACRACRNPIISRNCNLKSRSCWPRVAETAPPRFPSPRPCGENRNRLQHSAFCNPSTSCPALCRGCPVALKSPVTRENLSGIEPFGVLAGLVPAIHAAPLQETFEVGGFRTAWMPGTSPGTTRGGRTALPLYAGRRWREAPDVGRRELSGRQHERAPYASARPPTRATTHSPHPSPPPPPPINPAKHHPPPPPFPRRRVRAVRGVGSSWLESE